MPILKEGRRRIILIRDCNIVSLRCVNMKVEKTKTPFSAERTWTSLRAKHNTCVSPIILLVSRLQGEKHYTCKQISADQMMHFLPDHWFEIVLPDKAWLWSNDGSYNCSVAYQSPIAPAEPRDDRVISFSETL